jgi:NADPH:quinone reductase-like Zn-dependent oxidoreductase
VRHPRSRRERGVHADILALAELLDSVRLELPIAATYPLSQVGDANRALKVRHTRDKIVLVPAGAP